MKKRLLAVIMAALMLVGVLLGCSAQAPEDYVEKPQQPNAGGEGIYDSNAGSKPAEIVSRKLIRTISIETQTKDMDALLTDLDAQLALLGGYVQSKEIRGGSDSMNRYANMTLRIPAEKLDQFIGHVAGATNITATNETTEDVTLKYVATESRIAALEAEEARVLQLVAKAETLNEILTLESKLGDIRQELEEVRSQLKLYENLVDYGTVRLTIWETKEYTVVEEEPTVWQRIGTGFVRSLKGVGTIFTELFVFFVVASPYLAIVGVVVVVVVLAMRKPRRKKSAPPS